MFTLQGLTTWYKRFDCKPYVAFYSVHISPVTTGFPQQLSSTEEIEDLYQFALCNPAVQITRSIRFLGCLVLYFAQQILQFTLMLTVISRIETLIMLSKTDLTVLGASMYTVYILCGCNLPIIYGIYVCCFHISISTEIPISLLCSAAWTCWLLTFILQCQILIGFCTFFFSSSLNPYIL